MGLRRSLTPTSPRRKGSEILELRDNKIRRLGVMRDRLCRRLNALPKLHKFVYIKLIWGVQTDESTVRGPLLGAVEALGVDVGSQGT